jgi:hypothetical protein
VDVLHRIFASAKEPPLPLERAPKLDARVLVETPQTCRAAGDVSLASSATTPAGATWWATARMARSTPSAPALCVVVAGFLAVGLVAGSGRPANAARREAAHFSGKYPDYCVGLPCVFHQGLLARRRAIASGSVPEFGPLGRMVPGDASLRRGELTWVGQNVLDCID